MSKLRIALQKKGRLHQNSLKLIKDCGICFDNDQGKLKVEAHNFPIEILFLRDDDIPKYIAQGFADIGIIGENIFKESPLRLNLLEKLGFSKCRLSLAIPNQKEYIGLSYFEGKAIATTYPNILSEFLKENNISAQIEEISGSVEIAPGIDLAEGICDLVSSGNTLKSNGLKEVAVIMESEAVLVSDFNIVPEKEKILNKFLFRLRAVKKAQNHKYVLLNAPNKKLNRIIPILPGLNSPTIIPLALSDWSSVHTVIPEDDFWNIIDELRLAGAEGILVVPIEKMVL